MFCGFRYCGSLQFIVSTCNTFSNFKARALVGFQSQKRSLVQATKWALESRKRVASHSNASAKQKDSNVRQSILA